MQIKKCQYIIKLKMPKELVNSKGVIRMENFYADNFKVRLI